MPTTTPPAATPRYCRDCGTKYNEGARFCHSCGSPVDARPAAPAAASGDSPLLRVGVPIVALVGVVILSVAQLASRTDQPPPAPSPLGGRAMQAPDISNMSPEERADRLFNRVMLLSSQGNLDSAAFFAPMARSAIEALAPLDAHRRYDLGLVALVMGDASGAGAQAGAILEQRPTHLLGLVLAARAAAARGDPAAESAFRQRLLDAEATERAAGLQEYVDHDADLQAALRSARAP